MINEFEDELYDLVESDKVHITGHRFGHDKLGELDVWIESTDRGERFMSQLIYEGSSFAVRHEVFTKRCYILREKATGRYRFLDMNESGFWLHSDTFSGAETFFGDAAAKVEKWLAGRAN
jgi:hypothetical protein